MAKRKRRRGNPVLRQAKLEAEVKYGTPAHTLAMLLGQTRADLKDQIRVEQGTARGIEASAKAAIPAVKSYYDAAQGTRAQAQSLVDSKLAPLSSAADDIKAASAREAGLHQTQLAAQGAAALTDFRQRGVQAKAGAQYAISNARRQNRTDQAKIVDQLVQLGRERGTFTAATFESLKDADRKLNVTKRGQTLSHKDRRASDKRQAAKDQRDADKDAYQRQHHLGPYKPAAGNKPKAETAASHKVKLQIDDARSQIRALRARGKNSRQISKNARANGVEPVILNAARDLEYLGYVSRPNRAALKRAGVRIPKQWRVAPPRPPKRKSTGAGATVGLNL